MSDEKKPFFLKRWIESLFGWLDAIVFPSEPDRIGAVAVPFWWSLIVSFAFGLVVGIVSIFKKNTDTFNTVAAIIALVAVVGFAVFFLIHDLPAFETTGKKVGRTAYVLILCGIAFVVGFYLAMLVMYAAIAAGVFYLLYILVFGDSSDSRKKKRIKLDNGEELKVERGLCGEEYYTDSSGKEYERISSNTFREKE